MSFSARKSNPLWEFMDIDPNDSAQVVLRVLGGLVAAMPPVQSADLRLHDAALGVCDLPLAEIHPPDVWLAKGAWLLLKWLLLLMCLSVLLLWKCRTEPPDAFPLVAIDISTPQGSPAHTPPLSPLERMRASASEVSAGLVDLANVMVSRASSVTYASEDLAISESAAS